MSTLRKRVDSLTDKANRREERSQQRSTITPENRRRRFEELRTIATREGLSTAYIDEAIAKHNDATKP